MCYILFIITFIITTATDKLIPMLNSFNIGLELKQELVNMIFFSSPQSKLSLALGRCSCHTVNLGLQAQCVMEIMLFQTLLGMLAIYTL